MESYKNIQYGNNWYSDLNGNIHETWDMKFFINGFEVHVYIEGTEDEIRDYFESELSKYATNPIYHAMTTNEIQLVKQLNLQIYLA